MFGPRSSANECPTEALSLRACFYKPEVELAFGGATTFSGVGRQTVPHYDTTVSLDPEFARRGARDRGR